DPTPDPTPANQAPTDITLTGASVNENSASGIVIGILSTVDADRTETHTYRLLNDAEGRFIIDGTQLKVGNSALLDFETAANHQIVVEVTDSVGNTFQKALTLDVNDIDETIPNTPPTITPINDQSTDEDVALSGITFTIGDAETSPENLTITAISSNSALIGNSNIVITGTGANRTLSLRPNDNQFGTATVTIDVSDGIANQQQSFNFTVNSVNDLPTITSIANQNTTEETATLPLSFTIGDVETPVDALILTGTSSNAALIPDGNIQFSGTGANRSIIVTPAANQSGTATITIDVNDGIASSQQTFDITVTPDNDAPTIDIIGNQITEEDNIRSIPITLDDIDTDVNTLTVTATSGNQTLLPDGNITFNGAGASRNLVLQPAADQSGNTTITVTVSDGANTNQHTFDFTVTPINDAPQISIIPAQTVDEDGVLTINFTVTDGDSEGPFNLSSISSDQTLIPDENIVINDLGGNNYSATITPAPNQSGMGAVAIDIDDGIDFNSQGFNITVNAVNDAAAITTTATALSYTQNAAATVIDADITVIDVDSANLSSATVSISSGFVAGEDVLAFTNTANITATYSNGTLSLTGNATVGEYQAALQSITYQNTSNNPSTTARIISFVVDDGITPSSAATKTVNITAVNNTPALTATATALTYTENSAAIAIDAGITVTDADSTNLSSATVSITGFQPEDVLNFTAQNGITGTYDPATGILTLTGNATIAQYQTALQSITYQNTSENPNTTARTLSFSVNDGTSNSVAATRTLNITAANDTPALTATATALTYTENSAAIAIDAGITITDADSTNLSSATVSITNFQAEDVLNFTAQNGITGTYDPATGTL
ncbi:tandem-95 repeat protein, partial [Ancylothrix sp. C2]|uniref:beta strand repeat-containing protein n=1 Tax=Ancylothrix sp. D3o TaxID=2953691 RepID=UPI0021BA8F5F